MFRSAVFFPRSSLKLKTVLVSASPCVGTPVPRNLAPNQVQGLSLSLPQPQQRALSDTQHLLMRYNYSMTTPMFSSPYTRRCALSKTKTHSRNLSGTFEPMGLTVEEYHELIGKGGLDELPIELLNGRIALMSPQSTEHCKTVTRLTTRLHDEIVTRLRGRVVVRVSMPISLTRSEPEPDLAVIPEYFSGIPHPSSADVFLVVEVSNSSFRKDTIDKLEIYASEGIQEYWIVDVVKRSVRVLQDPKGNGYKYDETHSTGFIAPAAFPNCNISVDEMFPY